MFPSQAREFERLAMASKPIILAVDDDSSVLESVVRDLRNHYGRDYRILQADSGPAALDVCKQLQERGDAIALVVSDQRMPGMTGVEFLERSIQFAPDARRTLLTAYADTEAAIRAINSAKIHYYLTKPWDPPEEKLYPVLDDLLGTWCQGYKAPYEGLRVIGPRWSRKDHEVRDFLARNGVPFEWLNPESDERVEDLLRKRNLDDSRLPVVLFPDGSALIQPTRTELAGRVGLHTQAEKEFYDLIVVGAGLAGLAAGVYGASEGLRTLILEPAAPGGQAGSSSRIENYLGFPTGVSGAELAQRAYLQAMRFGVEFLTQEASGIRFEDRYRIVTLGSGQEISCHVLLLAMGVDYRRLGIPGLEEFTGAGVYYGAALTEAKACQNETVYIVGGANSAGQAAVYFSQYAKEVVMIVRAASLESSMSKYLIDQIAGTSNIRVETGTQVLEAKGTDRLSSIRVSTPRGEEEWTAGSLFVFIGAEPNTDWLPEVLQRDLKGFLLTGRDLMHDGKRPAGWPESRDPYLLETSMPGVFAAGDVRYGSIKRAASAVGEGSMAVRFAHQYLAGV
jgi:thioredoxin reductase (NADPH)